MSIFMCYVVFACLLLYIYCIVLSSVYARYILSISPPPCQRISPPPHDNNNAATPTQNFATSSKIRK